MKLILNHWYNFMLSILFWIFIWNLHDDLVDKLKLTGDQRILLNFVSLIIVIIFIMNSKTFFNYA
jgi:hypothetical protein